MSLRNSSALARPECCSRTSKGDNHVQPSFAWSHTHKWSATEDLLRSRSRKYSEGPSRPHIRLSRSSSCNHRRGRDWFGATGEGRDFLRHATEIKTIWVPYGE